MSNVGFIILGVLFIIIVSLKERLMLKNKERDLKKVKKEQEGAASSSDEDEPCWKVACSNVTIKRRCGHMAKELRAEKKGLCNGFQLFYTMGATLSMIGVMSGCYHICPSNVNFQFDVTYMYTLAIMVIINLFKARHPDLTPDIITAFGLLAYSILVGVRYS